MKYVGVTSRYFVMSVVNDGPLSPTGPVQPLGNNNRVSLVYPVAETALLACQNLLRPQRARRASLCRSDLGSHGDFGWFTIFAYPILKFLKLSYSFVGNYGVAIILLTLLLKLATYPLTYKSMKSMKEMAKLQPQLRKSAKNTKTTKKPSIAKR